MGAEWLRAEMALTKAGEDASALEEPLTGDGLLRLYTLLKLLLRAAYPTSEISLRYHSILTLVNGYDN